MEQNDFTENFEELNEQEEIEVELNELDTNEFNSLFALNKKILILGDKNSGKSTLIEKINIDGIVITDKNHLNKFYYKKLNVYTNYGESLKKRVFVENTCLIVDNYIIPNNYLESIKINLEEKNMLFLITSCTFINVKKFNFDYIFICKFTNEIVINNVYLYLKDTFLLNSVEELMFIVNECTQNLGDILIINCKDNVFMIHNLI